MQRFGVCKRLRIRLKSPEGLKDEEITNLAPNRVSKWNTGRRNKLRRVPVPAERATMQVSKLRQDHRAH